MKFGLYSDREIPRGVQLDSYHLNSYGYRCPEWTPMPDGKKNVVVLGCSHTFGQGNKDNEHWVHFLSQHNADKLRYWNLGQPGASADKIVRILLGCEKTIYPDIIIVCWPVWSRRERLLQEAESLTGDADHLKHEDSITDKNNFMKNVFFVEKFAEYNKCKTFHCFAEDSYAGHMTGLNVLEDYTLGNCWPYWDKFEQRQQFKKSSLASDGQHYGVEHHKRFASLFLDHFGRKLK
jgi:hypothetical protein